jgi:dihydrofolate synthase/folylpolyglutamate synthase
MIDGAARLEVTTARRRYGPITLGLRGAHQVPNALVAIALLETVATRGLPATPEEVASGLAAPDWPARLEMFTLEEGRRVLLDAAHNQDGAAALADYLRQWHPDRPPLVFGVMHDKDVDAMLRTLLPAVSALLATAAPSARAIPATELARRAAAVAAEAGHQIRITAVEDPEEAVRLALESAPLVCVAGSIFLAGPVRDALVRRAILR